MRILITEEALETGEGHWPSYLGDLTNHFRAVGDQVDVLIHREASSGVVSKVGGTPWYSRNCWRDSRSQGKIGGLVHNWHFYRETMRFLKGRKSYDMVFAPTMRMQHLLAFALMARSGQIPKSTRFVLLFVQGFGQYAGSGTSTIFPKSFSSRIARIAFRIMAPMVGNSRVILSGETAGMCDELRRFSKLPATLFPHPVEFSKESHAQKFPSKQSDEDSGELCEKTFTVTCPGFARHEKGSDLLHDAIIEILREPWGKNFRFVLQWPESFEMLKGGSMAPDPLLSGNKQVEFLNESLSEEDYGALLDRSDLVILPYRSQSYHQRLSRVAIEAAGRGIPLIYTSNTWTQEVAKLAGGGIQIESESAAAIVRSLREASLRHPILADAAQNGAENVRSFHSAESFRNLLFKISEDQEVSAY